MKIPSFEAFLEATDKDELNTVVIENAVNQLKESGVELDESDGALMSAMIDVSLSNTITLLAAYHEWLSDQLDG